MMLVQGWWWGWTGGGLQGESDEDRLSTASVPGWIPEMFDADSFINANLTAWKLQRTIKTSNVR